MVCESKGWDRSEAQFDAEVMPFAMKKNKGAVWSFLQRYNRCNSHFKTQLSACRTIHLQHSWILYKALTPLLDATSAVWRHAAPVLGVSHAGLGISGSCEKCSLRFACHITFKAFNCIVDGPVAYIKAPSPPTESPNQNPLPLPYQRSSPPAPIQVSTAQAPSNPSTHRTNSGKSHLQETISLQTSSNRSFCTVRSSPLSLLPTRYPSKIRSHRSAIFHANREVSSGRRSEYWCESQELHPNPFS